MITERTNYYAKDGNEAQVLAIRRRASAIRTAIGLRAGRIGAAAAASPDQPAVTWECRFTDEAAHRADMAARAASADFTRVRADMQGAVSRFTRHVFADDDAPLANGMREVSLTGHAVVPREIAFRSGAHDLRGYLFLPPGPGPFPLLVCNHGSGIDKGTPDVSRPGAAALLMGWGIASFLPHRHGYGNSTGPAWREDVSATFGTPEYDAQLAARLDRESDDIIAALGVVSALKDVRSDHIGVMGSSFGGTTTLLAAAKSASFRCAVDFAGAAMNWDRTPALRALMTAAALKLTQPLFLAQAANDYSVRPTQELAAALNAAGKKLWSQVYPAFGFNNHEGHLIESRGAMIWAADMRHFLEQFL